jgi:putative membrane protein insertion efficiency factor
MSRPWDGSVRQHAYGDLRPSQRFALGVLRAYKLLISPLFTGACRFHPSCSTYMAQAIRTHGTVDGVWLGLRRLARCHPLGSSGFDPVPPARH